MWITALAIPQRQSQIKPFNRGTNHKSEREQPRINVTAARYRAHEPIESRKIVRLGPTRR